jgi:transposase
LQSQRWWCQFRQAPRPSRPYVQETKAWLTTQPEGRFEFTFTPKHGSWLNLIEGFFSKLARSVLRHICVVSKQELAERILAAIDDINQQPVVHTWSYKLDNAT